MKLEKENKGYIDTPEFVILELIDHQIDMLEKDIKELKQLKLDIFYMINNDNKEYDWSDIYLRFKGKTNNEIKN